MRQKLTQVLTKLTSYIPTKLPVGLTAYQAWLDSIVELAGPLADRESVQWVISNEVMRLPPGKDTVSKNRMVKLLRKYAANQCAGHVVLELKAKQEIVRKAAEEAAKIKQQSEATAQPETNNSAGLQKATS